MIVYEKQIVYKDRREVSFTSASGTIEYFFDRHWLQRKRL